MKAPCTGDVRIASTTYVFDDDRKPLPRAPRPLDDELLPSVEGFRRVAVGGLNLGLIRDFQPRNAKRAAP